MSDRDCVFFLQWALPRLRMRWAGFRRVRGQVCKRIERRRRELGLADLDAYRRRLETDPGEWRVLDRLCLVTVSRFCRDRAVFAALGGELLPALAAAAAAGGRRLAVWSAGCASGEEPYSLALVWELGVDPAVRRVELDVLATDLDPTTIERARAGCYPAGSLRELPGRWRDRAFEARGGRFCLRPEFRRRVRLLEHDLRGGAPGGRFDLVLCRNVAFTYFDERLQNELVTTLAGCIPPGGALVTGAHEALPPHARAFTPWTTIRGAYRRLPGSPGSAGREL